MGFNPSPLYHAELRLVLLGEKKTSTIWIPVFLLQGAKQQQQGSGLEQKMVRGQG